MNSFPNLEPVHSYMSDSNCCFLTSIQVSEEASKVVWYSHLFKNVPQFVVIHIIKGFSIVDEAEIDVFLESSCFFYDQMDIGTLISGSSAFFKPSLYIWTFLVHVLLKPSLKDFEHYLTQKMCSCVKWAQLCDSLNILWHYFSLGFRMKTDLFQSCGPCWVFQIFWHMNVAL